MSSAPSARRPLFRREALAAHESLLGTVHRNDPRWLAASVWVVLASFVVAFCFLVFGRTGEFAQGTALVVFEKTTVVATRAGVIARVDVEPGDPVEMGQTLARFDTTVEENNLSSAQREFELELLERLRDPARATTSLSASHTRLELARRRLAEQVISVPAAGVVGDVRLRSGQHVDVGDAVMSIRTPNTAPSALIVLPGRFRPLVSVGMPVRIELAGFARSYQDAVISELSDDILGPAEVRRTMPRELSDSVPLSGSMIVLRARLPSSTFTAGGSFQYHEGMTGRAEVRLRERSIAALLLSSFTGVHE